MISQGKDKHLVVALLDTSVVLFFFLSFHFQMLTFYHVCFIIFLISVHLYVYKVSMNCLRASFTQAALVPKFFSAYFLKNITFSYILTYIKFEALVLL